MISALNDWLQLLVNYSINVQPGNWVLLLADLAAQPLVEEVCRAVLKSGGKPTLTFSSDEITKIFVEEASQDALRWLSPVDLMLFNQVDSIIYLGAAENSRSLSEVDPRRFQLHQLAQGELRKIRNQRFAKNELRWVYTQFPCLAYAQDAEMNLRDL